jgi:hypothetical protein
MGHLAPWRSSMAWPESTINRRHAARIIVSMAPLGALSQAWVSAEASLPLGWQISGLWRFDDLWVALSEGPAFEDYISGSGQYAEQALRRLADRLSERREPLTG